MAQKRVHPPVYLRTLHRAPHFFKALFWTFFNLSSKYLPRQFLHNSMRRPCTQACRVKDIGLVLRKCYGKKDFQRANFLRHVDIQDFSVRQYAISFVGATLRRCRSPVVRTGFTTGRACRQSLPVTERRPLCLKGGSTDPIICDSASNCPHIKKGSGNRLAQRHSMPRKHCRLDTSDHVCHFYSKSPK